MRLFAVLPVPYLDGLGILTANFGAFLFGSKLSFSRILDTLYGPF